MGRVMCLALVATDIKQPTQKPSEAIRMAFFVSTAIIAPCHIDSMADILENGGCEINTRWTGYFTLSQGRHDHHNAKTQGRGTAIGFCDPVS
jgi:hypothetical protein